MQRFSSRRDLDPPQASQLPRLAAAAGACFLTDLTKEEQDSFRVSPVPAGGPCDFFVSEPHPGAMSSGRGNLEHALEGQTHFHLLAYLKPRPLEQNTVSGAEDHHSELLLSVQSNLRSCGYLSGQILMCKKYPFLYFL